MSLGFGQTNGSMRYLESRPLRDTSRTSYNRILAVAFGQDLAISTGSGRRQGLLIGWTGSNEQPRRGFLVVEGKHCLAICSVRGSPGLKYPIYFKEPRGIAIFPIDDNLHLAISDFG